MAARATDPPDIPESDRLTGFAHPRETARLFGHSAAEAEFLSAYRSGRLHHAWLISGPEGIGKATFAYRIARFVLANPDPGDPAVAAATSLDVDPHTEAAHQVRALSHPDLVAVRRGLNPKSKALFTVLNIDEVRRAIRFFSMTSGRGGWRVAIVDCADEMNLPAANALLKTLEEPPERALILLVSHAPGGLLATIRSRCRRIALAPLEQEDLFAAVEAAKAGAELAALSGEERTMLVHLSRGSVRRALQILTGEGLAIYREIDRIIAAGAGQGDTLMHAFADRLMRRGAEKEYDMAFAALSDWVAERIEKEAVSASSASLARLAEVWEKVSRLAEETATFNYERKQMILKAFRSITAAAS